MGKLSDDIVSDIIQNEANQKIVKINPVAEDELTPFSEKDLRDSEEYHPMFLQYMHIIELLYMCSSSIYELPKLKKHRKMILRLEKTYHVGSLSSSILGSYFSMWEFFDAEVGNSRETICDVISRIVENFGLVEEGIFLLGVLKESINSIYTCKNISNNRAILEGIITGTEFNTAITESFFLEVGGRYMMRLLPAGEMEFLSITTPYELEESEEEWKYFFAKQKIYSGENFDLEKYRNFMRRGKFPGYWMDYIQTSAHKNQIPILLRGIPG